MREVGIEWLKLLGRVWFGDLGHIRMKNIEGSDTVPDDHIHIYSKNDAPHYRDDSQVEHQLGGGGLAGEILVADGECAPPVMLTTEDECDFLYGD